MSAPTPDSATSCGPFADWAGVYRHRGYWPRPITPGTKACHVREWQKPDSELSEATLVSWRAPALIEEQAYMSGLCAGRLRGTPTNPTCLASPSRERLRAWSPGNIEAMFIVLARVA
jgi:hypothetical protein